MIEDLLPVLGAAGLHPDARELCDALWLAPHVRAAPAVSDDTGPGPASAEPATAASDAAPVDTPGHAAGGGTTGTTLHTSGNGGGAAGTAAMQARGPAVPALRHQLRLARALRPFKRRIPDPGTFVVDEQATAARIAEEGLSPVLHPAPRRWLDLTLVVDAAPTMVVWRRTVAELRTLMEQMGAFRTVRVLRLYAPPDRAAAVLLLPEGRGGVELPPQGPDIECRRSTASLDTTAGGQAVLVVSDTVGPAWQDGRLDPVLRGWAAGAPLAVVTLLPQRMWSGAGLKAVPAALRAPFPGAPNAALDARVRGRPGAGTRMPAPDVPVPVLELSERWLAQWADLVAGAPSWRNAALLVPQAAPVGVRPAPGAAQAAAETVQAAGAPSPTGTGDAPSGSSPGARLAADPAAVVRRFRAAASPTAFRLACCLSAAWLNLPVMRLVQRVALPDSDTSHLAEVYLGGLLTASMDAAGADPEQVAYDFLPGVRAELNQYLTRHDMVDILERTSAFVAERFGQPLDFPALLADPASAELPVRTGGGPPLAYVAASVLAQLGGQYAVLAARLPRAAVPNAEPVDTVSAPNAEPLSVTTAPAMGSWDAAPASATPTTPADDLADRATAPADPAAARPSAAPPEDVVAALLRELRRVGKGGQASALAERAIANTDLANPHAVAGLLQILLNAGMHQQVTAMLARDLAAHAAVDDPSGVAVLLEVLREAGASEQMTVLLERDPAAHAALDDPSGVAVLLEVLREAGASEQMTVLLERDPAAHAALDDPSNVASLLEELRKAGASEQMTMLAGRAAAYTAVDRPGGVALLLRELREAGASEQMTVLLERDPAAHAALDDPLAVARLLEELRKAGANEQMTALARRAAAHAALDDPLAVAVLLEELREAGANEQMTALARRAAAHAVVDDPSGVAWLLRWLREAGASEQMTVLLERDPAAHAALDDPSGVAMLLEELREAGASEQMTVLLERDPAAHAAVDRPSNVALLLRELREAGANEQMTALARRAAAHAALDDPSAVAELLEELREGGVNEQMTVLLERDPAAHAALDSPSAVARLLEELRKAGANQQASALLARDSGHAIPRGFHRGRRRMSVSDVEEGSEAVMRTPHVVVVMGVAGTGKTTIGPLLAARLGVPYAEGDDFHPRANIAKMTAGVPLDDEDRWPWLDAIGAWAHERAGLGGVVSCSALKRSYRDRLRAAAPGVVFVHLTGDRALIEDRMSHRQGHFMPTALLDSQFATLQPLGADEAGVGVDVAGGPEEIAERAVAALDRLPDPAA